MNDNFNDMSDSSPKIEFEVHNNMMPPPLLSLENNPIRRITTQNDHWRVDEHGITEIQVMAENGQTWFVVNSKNGVIARVNAAFVVSVIYM